MPSLVGLYSFEQELSNLNNWIEAINIIKMKFTNYSLQFKLHPLTKQNPELYQIQDYIKSKCKGIDIINPSVNAQKLIHKSQVVISDVSTVLWWANFLEKKKIISMDLKNFINSDQMKYYHNVYYFENIEKLKNFNF